VPLLDELASGIAPASAPDIAATLGVSGGTTAGAMIVAFHSLAFFVEAPLLAWSERVRARWFSAASLAAVGASALLAALYPRGWALLLALALYGPASGCALAIAEGVLVESAPHARERAMARAGLAASAGDLAVPLLLAALARFDLGWRTACALAGALALVLAVAHASSRSLDRAPSSDDGSEPSPPPPTLREALRTALATRPLFAWSLACTLTNLLDEVLVAFGALHLAAIGATANERSRAIAAWVVGGFAGLAAIERFITARLVRRVLLGASAIAIVALVTLATTRSPGVATIALFAIGATGTALHPLTKAQSYAALPSRPALVNAVASALLPLDIVTPIVLGLLATHAGTSAAIAGLILAPLGVVIAAWRVR
jgi:predicted MFS family arabinose efflux permease